jgi:N-methylhydantoinase A
VNDFHATHERRFGYCAPSERVQVVNVRLKARVSATDLMLKPQQELSENVAIPMATRSVTFAGIGQPASYAVPIYERSALQPGGTLSGPAIITQYDTTTVVPPSWQVQVDAVDNLIIEQIVEPLENE